MKKVNFTSLIFFIFIAFQATVYSNITKKYDYKDFTMVSVGHGMHLKIEQSDSYSISIKADEKDMKSIKVEKSGNELKIYVSRHFYRFEDEVYINITMPELKDLDLGGGSEGNITMKTGSKPFTADLSGGSSLTGKLNCGDVSLSLSGGSTTSISGNCKDLNIEGSGGSIFKLKNFTAANVNSDLSGGSQASINTNGVLNTDQSGGSHITFFGDTKMGDTNFSGGSYAEHGD